MTRLTYTSERAFLRAIQISSDQITVFVEGREDTYFYDRLCSPTCEESQIRIRIRRAHELPAGAPGKPALLKWYNFLKSRGKLFHDFKGKRLATLFFLDKDVDDLARIQKRSGHIVYTEYYDFEGYLFREGDVVRAIAAAAQVDERRAVRWLGPAQEWRRRASERWKDWVKLCLFANLRKLPGVCNYGAYSQLNTPLSDKVDSVELARRRAELESASGLGRKQFERAFRRVAARVDSAYAADRAERVFKAKWYPAIAEDEIRRSAGSYPINGTGLRSRLPECLLLTLNFDESWSEWFKGPLRALIARL
jgi:hypothetical protein